MELFTRTGKTGSTLPPQKNSSKQLQDANSFFSTGKIEQEPSDHVQPKQVRKFITRSDGEIPSKKDLAVIMSLWTTELLRVAFETFQSRAVEDYFPKTSDKKLIFSWKLMTYGTSLCFMFLVALATSWWHKVKYWSFVSSMFRYFISPITGLWLSFRHEAYFAIFLNISTIFWYGAHPLRYSLVFHQYFPIHVTHSRRIVTVNVILIWITRYLCFSMVTDVKYLSEYAFKLGWIVMLVVCPLWLVALCLLGPYRNHSPEKLEAVRNFYVGDGERKSFDRRQNWASAALVVLILYPCVIFTLLMTLSEVSLMLIARLSPEVDQLLAYRIDLIIAIVVAVLIEVAYSNLKWARNELFELVLITLAFMVKLLHLVMTIPVVRETSLLPVPNNFMPENSICKVVLFGMPNPKNVVIQIDEFVYFSNQDADRIVFLATVPVTYSKVAPVRISLYPTGEVIHESDIELVSNKIIIYNFHEGISEFRGSWIKARWTDYVNSSQTEPQLILFNMMSECLDYDEEGFQHVTAAGFVWDEFSLGSRSTSCPKMCFPFRWTLTYKINNESVNMLNLSVSNGYGLDSRPISVPCLLSDTHCQGLYKLAPNNVPFQQLVLSKNHMPKRIFRRSTFKLQPFSIYLIRLEQGMLQSESCFEVSRVLLYNKTVPNEGINKIWTIFLLAFNSVPHITVAVSYVQFMWMQLPIKRRTLIIYGYCSLDALAEWIPLGILKNMKFSDEFAKMVVYVTAGGMVWHMAVSVVWMMVIWRRRIPEERNLLNKRI